MKLQIVWTPEAFRSLDEIKMKLEEHGTEDELYAFFDQVFAVIQYLRQHPNMHEASRSSVSQHKAFITEQVSLIYRYKEGEKEVYLLQFWDNAPERS